jgi:hypothetical protein
MKTIVTGFFRDQSGAIDFNDGMTVFVLVVVGPIALYLLLATFGGVYDAVFGLVADAARSIR